MSSSISDTLMPKVLTDFIFDLYDSVTLSQIPEEQAKLYETDFRELCQKYFSSQPWPSPHSIAADCNGDPLFLAVYRELTHRHWHAVTRPTLRDRIEGFQVYRELFEEMLDDSSNFYLLPSWTFDILNEFVYQFQGFCQVRSAVYASARKHGLIHPDTGTRTAEAATTTHTNLLDNWNTLENASDAWDVEVVFGYLHRLTSVGWCKPDTTTTPPPPVYTYLSIFGAVAQSRLECLLGDYTACLQALTPLSVHGSYVIPKDLEELEDGASHKRATVQEALTSVFGARTSVAYHAGVSLLMLRRYKDAARALNNICAVLQRGFKTGQLRQLPSSDQFMKQYDRMIALLALLTYLCPATTALVEDSLMRVIRDKHGSKLETASSYEEWFQSPKFISVDPAVGMYRHQVQRFSRDHMATVKPQRTLRSYLKLYTALTVDKLANFHDMSTEEFIPSLLSYKLRMKQLTTDGNDENYMEENATYKTALDIHYYVEGDTVHVDEAERPRRFENYFVGQIKQGLEIRKDAMSIDAKL